VGFSAYRRPDSGFHESLALARGLIRLAEFISDQVDGFTAERNAALSAWSGPWGEEFRRRADDEDEDEDEDDNLAEALEACEHEADQWANAWHDAVTEMNGVVYAEACAEQRAHLEEKRRREEANRNAPSPG
jgi:hypothetical protein